MAQKVLVVDDDVVNLQLMTKIVKSQNYDVTEAMNGTDALEAVTRDQPDLIVLDYQMPDIDGIEVCKKVRANLAIKQPVILMCTAQSRALDRVQSLLAGANDYILKPVSPIDLIGRIGALLHRPAETSSPLPSTPTPNNPVTGNSVSSNTNALSSKPLLSSPSMHP